MRSIAKSFAPLALLAALLVVSGCGGGGGGIILNSSPPGQGDVVSGYTLQAGETGITGNAFLNFSSLSNQTVGWGKQLGPYGTISFGDKSVRTGTFTSSSPVTNAAMTWTVVNTAITLTISTSPVLTYTYAQLAVNPTDHYYVMMKSQVISGGSLNFIDYERWYFGTNGPTSAQAFATTVKAFSTSLISGKRLQNVNVTSPLWTGSTDVGPNGIVVDGSGGIYVVNTRSNTVQKFTTASTAPVWTGTTDPNPIAVALDANGGIYVVNSNPNPTQQLTVQKFTTAATTPVGIGIISGSFPNSIAVDATGNNIYVTCALSNHVEKLPALTSTITPATSTVLAITGQNPSGVAIDASNGLYVSNFLSNTVQKFDATTGALLWTGSTASGPTGVAVDGSGGIFVSCANSNAVQKFTTAATTPAWTGSTGALPSSVAVDGSGGIFVTCTNSNVVQKFTTAATTPVWTGNTGTSPSAVTVDTSGGIFVTNATSSTVQKFSVTGFTTVYTFNASGSFSYTVTTGISGAGTWVVNSDGTLTLNFNSTPASSITFTMLSGSTTSALIVNAVHNDGTTESGITLTFI